MYGYWIFKKYICRANRYDFTYDEHGNLVDDGDTAYTCDAANRLVETTAGEVSTSFTYNGDGNRVSQTVDMVTTTTIIDTATPLACICEAAVL